jgi:hypothetical protein
VRHLVVGEAGHRRHVCCSGLLTPRAGRAGVSKVEDQDSVACCFAFSISSLHSSAFSLLASLSCCSRALLAARRHSCSIGLRMCDPSGRRRGSLPLPFPSHSLTRPTTSYVVGGNSDCNLKEIEASRLLRPSRGEAVLQKSISTSCQLHILAR